MIKRESNFFEEHIEKIILVVAGVVCMWLSIMFVIFSPTKVAYDNEEFAPSEIDKYIFEKDAKELEYRLDEEPGIVGPYKSQVDDFERRLASAVDIKTDIYPLIPMNMKDVGVQPKYALPQMGQVKDVFVDVISTVAYLPTSTISEDNFYGQLAAEPNDLDLVTVEARFDVKGLYQRFKERFAGSDVKPEWRDEELGEPVFAAVQLQRKEQLEDGRWSDWADMSRSRIEARRQLFEIIEDVQDLPPGGIKVRLLDFEDKEVRINLLQPEAYRIASADEQWFPPSLHKRYEKYQEEMKRLKQIESRASEPARRRTAARGGDTDATFMREMAERGYRIGGVTEQATSAKIREITKSIDELYGEFEKLLITEDMDLSALEEPLLIWAFDDSIEQKKKYRYRIRVGVFNPIAGTEKFADTEEPKKNDVILWSNYAEAEDVVEVPGRLYFFARGIQKAEKAVTVTVCRRTLGYWYTRDFMVKPGEKIGKSVELEKTESREADPAAVEMMGMPGTYFDTTVVSPEVVDYSTGAVLLDAVDVNDWAGRANLYERYYTMMLYSYNGAKIYRMPVKQDYWPAELRILFGEIRQSEKETKEPLRPWTDMKRRARQRTAPQPQPGFEQEAYYRMMMEQMQRSVQRK